MRRFPIMSAATAARVDYSEALDRLAARDARHRPLATYRLQFHAGFRFADALQLVDYFSALGISHLYSSPIFKARAGSTHGYDITDHNKLNPEVGTDEEFRAWTDVLKARGIGLVLDIVPNHVGIGEHNPWWQDVLANGRSSRFAEYFDIDWSPLKPELENKVLLPVLGLQYGEELESGRIKLEFDGEFYIAYYDKRFPLDVRSYNLLLEPALSKMRAEHGEAMPETKELDAWMIAARELAPHSTSDAEFAQQRRKQLPALKNWFKQIVSMEIGQRAIEAALFIGNGYPGEPHSFDLLHRVLEAQPYRLAHWRVSAEEINYRRFFDINDLIGLRMENPHVFAHTHRLLRRLMAEGRVTALRVDHPDGLFNPVQYFTRLQMLFAASQISGPEPAGPVAENGIEESLQELYSSHPWLRQPPLSIYAEKILEPGEELPQEWPVEGTVGYEFGALLNGIFVDPKAERAFTNLFHRFTGISDDVETMLYESKKLILDVALSGELNVLTHLMEDLRSMDRHARDFTPKMLRDSLRECIACFPVYRTYVDERGTISESDRMHITRAIVRAKRRNPGMPAQVFDFLRDILLLQRQSRDKLDTRRRQLYFTLRFQQLTGPVMAKGFEDTVFYVYNRFVALNEVGGSPQRFGTSLDEFHSANMKRQQQWPGGMLSTSTHDTKRSEDVRARLDVLSEMPRTWSAHVHRWRRLNRAKKRVTSDGRSVPDGNEEYLLYQTLVGSWPWELNDTNRGEYVARIQQYMTKGVHEAKVNLSWVNQNPEYIEALTGFIDSVLQPKSANGRVNPFVQDIQAFVPGIAFFGAINSLTQTLLKLTAPGVPDVYQGAELWDFSLVDPDNRRPVDFARRKKLLEELQTRAATGDLASLAAELTANPQDGRIKLWTTMGALGARRTHAELFRSGDYLPVYGRGKGREHVAGFARYNPRTLEAAISLAPRFAFTLMRGEPKMPLGDVWGDTEIALPPGIEGEFVNLLTGEVVRTTSSRSLLCREVFASFPVALLLSR
ncbi:MAG: malto-oligosyltrehalose synthase [Terriglobales bacterium]